MINRLSRVAVAALLSAAAACGSDTRPAGPPASIQTVTSPTASVQVGAAAGAFVVQVTDASGIPVAGSTVTFTVSGGGTASPASTPTDASGQAQASITAGTSAGAQTVTAAVSGSSVKVSAGFVATPIPCPASSALRTLAVGEIAVYQSVCDARLAGTSAGAEFTLIAFNSDATSSHGTTITATGTGTAPTAARLAPLGSFASRSSDADLLGGALHPDLAFHARLRAQATKLAPLIPAAQRWLAARRASSSASGSLAPAGASRSAIPSNPKVGDLVSLNVDGAGDCTTIQMKTAMVVAIGTKSVVLADTTNPSGGFTATDYQNFAAKFDTLIYDLDVTNFGAPSDIDGNGRVGILFTRAVNELTTANSSSYVGGFFADRDLFPKTASSSFDACPGSNEGEMFYMLAPDPSGVVHGNVRTTSLVVGLTAGTIAHEFQHLINSSRRLFVNKATQANYPEVTWLNEGLSHVAEELLYYREAKRLPRTDLTDANIRQESSANYAIWKADESQNFQRFAEYLNDPTSTGVQGTDDYTDDELATRGATWSFLRYAADRFYTSDSGVWFKLVNSTTTGLNTLKLAFGADPVSVIRDYTVANYTDDAPYVTNPNYQHQSWNFHDIFTRTYVLNGGGAPPYPLAVTGLPNGASVSVSVARTTAGYFRLSVPANGTGVIGLSGDATTPSASLQFLVVRTK